MASAITLKGIDQAISSLKYRNKDTLKYRFVHHIRQYYTRENCVESLDEIDHTELIKILWDTDGSFEAIKNKRKNLNSIRSSVNSDLKKLYDKGENPEGIKIASGNIFIMSEEAKDKILNTFGYDLQPDGTLKLDQIMDILKLANETVSGSMAVEETEKKDGLKKIDRLKDLIKGLSEKVGLGSLELSKAASEEGGMAGKGVEHGSGSMGMAEVFDEALLDEVEAVEDIDDLEEVAEEELLDDIEDVEIDEIADADLDELVETEEIDEELVDVLDEEDTELDDVEEVDDVEEMLDAEIPEEPAGESGPGDEDALEGIGLEQDSDQEKTGPDVFGDEALSEDVGTGLETGDKEEGEGVGHGMVGKGDEQGVRSIEMDEILENLEVDAVGEIEEVEDLDEAVEEFEDIDDDEVLDEAEDVAEDDVFELAKDTDPEEKLEGIEGIDADEIVELSRDKEDTNNTVDVDEDGQSEIRFEEGERKDGYEQLGLPVDSLGQEYSLEVDSKIKKNRLLAEEFDGYLGSMDRYYNQYILIQGGEYLIGSKHPEKDEKPEQIERLGPFYFGRFPITNGLFEIFVEKTGYKTTAEKVGYGTVYYGRFEKKKDAITGLITSIWNSSLYCKRVEGACWYRPSGAESSIYNKRNHPVVQISMEDAAAFAAWTGKRLPTEKEWEAASRTRNGWIFPWGQEWEKDACNIEDSCTADTTPVDKYVKFENDFGIVDTMGNVLEWTHVDVDPMSKKNDEIKYQIVKGGSWVSGNDIRLFSRFRLDPKSHSNILGFRCVAD